MEDELVPSLTSFLRLYSRRRGGRRDRLQSSSALTAAQPRGDVSETKTFEALLVLSGGVVGATCGAVFGGVFGALGSFGAAVYRDVHVSFFGFFGSVCGGVVGGVVGGTVGSMVCTVAEAEGGPVNGLASDVVWLTIGFATGGAIGSVFGGAVGGLGGGVGGALGAFCATKCVVSSVGAVTHCYRKTKDSKEQEIKAKKVNMMVETAGFREAVTPLMEELIKTTCDKMASDGVVQGAAREAAESLTAALG